MFGGKLDRPWTEVHPITGQLMSNNLRNDIHGWKESNNDRLMKILSFFFLFLLPTEQKKNYFQRKDYFFFWSFWNIFYCSLPFFILYSTFPWNVLRLDLFLTHNPPFFFSFLHFSNLSIPFIIWHLFWEIQKIVTFILSAGV